MKKILVGLCLSLMVCSANGASVKSNKVVNSNSTQWVKLNITDIDSDDLFSQIANTIENVKNGVAYQNINGKKYVCGKVINGLKEGNWVIWHPNGRKGIECTYINDSEEGKCIQYYPNGQKEMEGIFKNGDATGKWIGWYENGRKESEGIFKNGEPEGKWRYWDEYGHLEQIVTFEEGEMIDAQVYDE